MTMHWLIKGKGIKSIRNLYLSIEIKKGAFKLPFLLRVSVR